MSFMSHGPPKLPCTNANLLFLIFLASRRPFHFPNLSFYIRGEESARIKKIQIRALQNCESSFTPQNCKNKKKNVGEKHKAFWIIAQLLITFENKGC